MTDRAGPARIARLERQLGIVEIAAGDPFLQAYVDGMATPPEEISGPALPEERPYQRFDRLDEQL